MALLMYARQVAWAGYALRVSDSVFKGWVSELVSVRKGSLVVQNFGLKLGRIHFARGSLRHLPG